MCCEDVAVDKIADGAGTPAYVYSGGAIEAAYRRLDRAFGALPHAICYAVKANSNLAVLKLLAKLGSSFDIVSGGELDRLRRIGVDGSRIVFSGVGKTRDEMREALKYQAGGKRGAKAGIFVFNIESEAELETLLEEATRHVKSGGNARLRPFASTRMLLPADINTFRRASITTSSASIGRLRGVFILRTKIRRGSAGAESAHTLARKS